MSLQHVYYEAYRHTAEVHGIGDGTRRLLNDLARHGKSTKAEIRARLGINERTIRKNVELARRAGVPVMSSSGESAGYWLAVDADEIAEFVAHEIDSRLASLREQRDRLAATAARVRSLRVART